MSLCEQNSGSNLTQKLLFLKINRAAFVGHVTRLISKIETCIFNSDKVKKVLCLKQQLAANINGKRQDHKF